jgi:hypothetical protein
VDAITRLALHRYPKERHAELELLFYSLRGRHPSVVEQLREFQKIADRMTLKE